MISATEFARHSSVWRQATPMLEQFVRWANSEEIRFAQPVHDIGSSQRHSLVSEVAFGLAAQGITPSLTTPQEIEARAQEFISQLPRGAYAQTGLLTHEWRQAGDMAHTILGYLTNREAVYQPDVPGCGVVDRAVADVLSGSELIEVKAVSRPLRGLDFRQLLTYSAMYYGSSLNVVTVTLLNPRRGTYFSTSLSALAVGVGASSGVELLQDLVQWMIGLQTSA